MLPALIAAGAQIAGGMLQKNAQEKENARQEAIAQKQYEQQKEFAQSGIQWKVADAQKAGIHPLYALGANTISYTPQSVGGGASDMAWLGDAGANIGRAIDATRSNPAKAGALEKTVAAIQLEGLRLDNEYKKALIASTMATTRQAGSAPGLPGTSTVPALVGMPGQGDAPQVEPPSIDLSKKMAPTSPGNPGAEYGAAPEVAWYADDRGRISPQVPQGLSESFEQDKLSYWQWYYRNKIVPQTPPPGPAGKNRHWEFDYWSGTWDKKWD